MHRMSVFDEILPRAEEMSIEDQRMIIDILRSRYIEKRREGMLRNAEDSLGEYRQGKTSSGGVLQECNEPNNFQGKGI